MNKISPSLLLVFLVFSTGAYATATVDSVSPIRSVAGCTPSFEINVTGETQVYPNSTAKINITIWDMDCGLDHLRMKMSGLNFNHTHSPEYFAAAPPLETRTFKVNITIPPAAQAGSYPAILTFTSNKHNFEKSFSFTVKEKIKEKEPEPRNLTKKNETGMNETETKEKPSFFERVRLFFKNLFNF